VLSYRNSYNLRHHLADPHHCKDYSHWQFFPNILPHRLKSQSLLVHFHYHLLNVAYFDFHCLHYLYQECRLCFSWFFVIRTLSSRILQCLHSYHQFYVTNLISTLLPVLNHWFCYFPLLHQHSSQVRDLTRLSQFESVKYWKPSNFQFTA
jgi:hypothetical protein